MNASSVSSIMMRSAHSVSFSAFERTRMKFKIAGLFRGDVDADCRAGPNATSRCSIELHGLGQNEMRDRIDQSEFVASSMNSPGG